jgi:Cysteine rich repeat
MELNCRIHEETAMPSVRRVLWVPAIAVALVLFLALLAIFHLPAFAQGRVCADDVAKFCQSVKGGQGQIMQCLKEHEADLSPQCQARVQAMATHMKEMSAACQSDVQQFCTDVSPGRGRLAQCLKQHESELSSSCQTELAQARSMRRSHR